MRKFLASNWPHLVLNGMVLLAGVGTYLMNNEIVAQNPDAVGIIGAVVGALNMILKVFGKQVPAPPAKQ